MKAIRVVLLICCLTGQLASLPAMAQAPERTLASEHFRVIFPARADERLAAEALRILEAASARTKRVFETAGMRFPLREHTQLKVYATTGDFCGATGQPAWAGAVTRGAHMHAQPLQTLKKRGALETTLRHEFTHVVLEVANHGRTPRWLAEGLAIHMAGEAALYTKAGGDKPPDQQTLERELQQPAKQVTPARMRMLYAQSWREVKRLLDTDGEAAVWRRAAGQ
ncbi:MAG: hypothetical protein ACKV2V_08290 [Blastocatellia bacterium]